MNLEKKLAKIGIEPIREFTPREVRYIAEEVTEYLVKAFSVLENNYNELLIRLLNCKMFFSYFNEETDISKVNYVYENNAIYFQDDVNLNNIDDKIIHECIHCLQDNRTSDGKLKKIGLCDFEEFSTYGIGINEAAVQYIAAKTVGKSVETVKRSGIILKTISPNYYPFITSLINQIVYLIGEKIIVEGTIECKDEFEDVFLNTFEEKASVIIKKFDQIIDIRNKRNGEISEENKEILNKEIANVYLETQELIMKTYFNKICSRVNTLEEVDFYIEKFLNYKNLVGIEEINRFNLKDNYEEYKEELLKKFDRKIMEISKERGKNTLSVIYNNKLYRFFKKILSYFST